jgi:hypothetical protein
MGPIFPEEVRVSNRREFLCRQVELAIPAGQTTGTRILPLQAPGTMSATTLQHEDVLFTIDSVFGNGNLGEESDLLFGNAAKLRPAL